MPPLRTPDAVRFSAFPDTDRNASGPGRRVSGSLQWQRWQRPLKAHCCPCIGLLWGAPPLSCAVFDPASLALSSPRRAWSPVHSQIEQEALTPSCAESSRLSSSANLRTWKVKFEKLERAQSFSKT